MSARSSQGMRTGAASPRRAQAQSGCHHSTDPLPRAELPTLLLPSRAVASLEPVSIKSFVIVYPYMKDTQSTLQICF